MARYITLRLLNVVVVIIGVTFITFGLMFLSGDPVAALAGENWTVKEIAEFR
jgi:ABC-type dipeptide/oligopeptide/nickel transport system permease component